MADRPPVTITAKVNAAERSPATASHSFAALNFLFPICVLAMALLAYWPSIRDGHVDFRNSYTAGYMVRTGNSALIYNLDATKQFQDQVVSNWNVILPFMRPAYEALFFVPFSLLSFRGAYFAFFCFNLALIVLTNQLLHHALPDLDRIRFAPAAMFIYFPLILALLQSQNSILLLALLAGAAMNIKKGSDSRAGILVALGLFKFQYVIPIFLLFVAWRRWRFAAAFTGTAAVLAALSLWITGRAASIEYFRTTVGLGSTLKFDTGLTLNMSLMANLHGLISVILNGSPLVMPVTLAATAALMIFSALIRPQNDQALYLAIPVSALVSYYMYVHDMSILLIPIAAAIASAQMSAQPHNKRMTTLYVMAILLLVIPIVSLFIRIPAWIGQVPLLIAFTVLSTLFWSARPNRNPTRTVA